MLPLKITSVKHGSSHVCLFNISLYFSHKQGKVLCILFLSRSFMFICHKYLLPSRIFYTVTWIIKCVLSFLLGEGAINEFP